MNILLITFSFPPAGGVGVLRALSLAKYLPENGICVDVLTARNAPAVGRDRSLLAQVPASVTIHRTWTLDLPFALRKAVKRIVSRHPSPKFSVPPASVNAPQSSSPERSDPKGAGSRGKAGNPLKRLLANLLLPDPQVGWLPFALPAARRIIRSRQKLGHPIDAVLITVPPFSSAKLVSSLRSSFPSLPIFLDFRDEWLSTTLDLVSFNKNAHARKVAHRTEREAVHAATRVVLVTEAARAELVNRYPGEPSTKFLCIHNGFDRPLTQPAESLPTSPHLSRPDPERVEHAGGEAGRSDPSTQGSAQTVTLTYIGTVYGSTDPSTLVAAVHLLRPSLQGRLRLRFIGHIETDTLRERLHSLPPGILEVRGFVPQAEALRAIDSTDWLLLVTHDRINVAAKFYDYLGGGKPIIAAVHPEGDVRRLLEQTRAGLWADVSSPEAIAALLVRVLDPTASDAVSPGSIHPDLGEIARFHRRALATRYAQELGSATSHARTPQETLAVHTVRS